MTVVMKIGITCSWSKYFIARFSECTIDGTEINSLKPMIRNKPMYSTNTPC